MRLSLKFNLVLGGVFCLGILGAGAVSYELLQRNSKEEILQDARIIMKSALAEREYIIKQIVPLLETQMRYSFLPQSVPAYGATETFNLVQKEYRDFSYKEAALNPTDPRDRVVDWEEDILREFREGRAGDEIIGERATPLGNSLFLARPIQIKVPACLKCHGVPSEAPRAVLDRYGSVNGFGWKVDEIVAAQIVSVPTAAARARALYTFKVFMISLTGVFLGVFLALNFMLRFIVIRPVVRLATVANLVSLGESVTQFETKRKDEIGDLVVAFGRLRKSFEKAMRVLQE